MRIRSSIALLVIALSFSSCGDKPVYDEFKSVNDSVWTYSQKMDFPVQIDDASSLFDFKLVVRVTTEYEFNNMWVFLTTTTPDGQSSREPFEIQISYEDGSWVGEKSGTIVESTLLFNRRKLPETGVYTFTVEQGIVDEKLNGVLDVGFIVEAVN